MSPLKKKNETEVVAIRISKETKMHIQQVAEKEYRTLAEQCRMILDEWSKKRGS